MEIQELHNLDRIFDTQALECILRSVRISNAPDYPPSIIDYQLTIYYIINWLIKKMESSYFIVALIDDTIVGTGALKDGEIKHVYVDPEHQRRDVGRSLMEELE